MTYRDELRAALARISSLERIIKNQEQQIKELGELISSNTTRSKAIIKLDLLRKESKSI